MKSRTLLNLRFTGMNSADIQRLERFDSRTATGMLPGAPSEISNISFSFIYIRVAVMFQFLRFVGEAVVAKGMRGIIGLVPLGEHVYDIAADAINRYKQYHRERELAADVENMLQASVEQIRQAIPDIVQSVAADCSPDEKQRLESYLTEIPLVAKNSLRRPEDPRGTTLLPNTNMLDPHQLASLLPRRMPKFRQGDKVPGAESWILHSLLGAGGFGEVWLAENSFLGQRRAYKFCLDAESRERLLRHEGEVVKRVLNASKHLPTTQDGIVPLLDAHLDGDSPWLAYAYVHGGDLANLAARWRKEDPEVRMRNTLQVLHRLAKVVGQWHRLPEPIAHRDLKPANVLVENMNGKIALRVTDFGIGSLAMLPTSMLQPSSTPKLSLGATYRGAHTPLYASPQQKNGQTADVRDDVFALGINGFQMLLGDWNAERPSGKWRKRLALLPLPDGLLDLLESCWDDDPEERPQDALVLAEALRAMLKVATEAPVNSAKQQLRHLELTQANDIQGNRPMELSKVVMERISSFAVKKYCKNLRMRQHVEQEQVSAFHELQVFQPDDIPHRILAAIREQAINEYPDDFNMQLHAEKEQVRAYRALLVFGSSDVSPDALALIRRRALEEYPHDFGLQLHIVQEQVAAFRTLHSFDFEGIDDAAILVIKRRAIEEYPFDFNMQLYVQNNQVESYRKLAKVRHDNITVEESHSIRRQAQEQYADDFVMQLYVVKELTAKCRRRK